MLKYIYILFLLSSSFIIAQSDKMISKERYHLLMDSLSTEKTKLSIEKDILLKEIDSLKNRLVVLEEESISTLKKQLIRKYGKVKGTRLANGQIWKGMTEKMLEDSWGMPDTITKNKEKWGLFRQWYYGDITYFFRDGIMTGWEEIK